MASSDDESDYVVETVSNYEFLDETDDPVSFSLLPIQWEENEIIGSETQLQVFLKGNADNGLQTVLKQVIWWKFDLGKGSPEISVLTKDKTWIKLVKPRKAFSEKIIRSILITIHCLHYVRRDANVSEKLVWDYLSRVFNSFDVRPSCNDLVDHIPLIAETVKRDDSLKKCKFLLAFLEEKPRKRVEESSQAAKLSEFIIDDEDDYFSGEEGENGDDDASNDDDDLFDPVCVFCDNGGELLCCEGECLRSFHATEEAGIESSCESLNMTDRQVEQMSIFVCDNCKHKQHQCFACGKLGSSDKSSGAEVFRCINATCGHFYHPYCVAILLRSDDKVAAKELREKIAAGEKFACPIHKCKVCKQPENTKEVDFQLAICRRCPTSYHRKCLPREIGFEDIEEENIITRAWEGLLPNRVLIYCLKHEIIDDIGTPVRDHVKFPFKREKIATEEKTKKRKVEIFGSNERDLAKKKRLSSENSFSRRTIEQAPRDMSSTVKKIERKAGISRYVEKLSSAPDLARKCKAGLQSIRSTRDNAISSSMEIDEASNVVANKPSLGERLYTLMSMQFENEDTSFSKLNEPLNMKTTSRKFSSEMGQLDSVAEKRLLGLVQEASSSITMRNVMSKHKILSEHGSSFKGFHDKTFTLGKVEGTVEAVRTALQKLKDGCSVDDAKTFCGPEVLNKIFKWKRGLKVYLAPFLHGMRYTSFGRHFTKEEKLKEIVDMLHWYVEDGDMLVDFCCGANDFSCLLKKKLDETGKTCLFKNYDIVQPKNDFNFEQRNWMTVRPEELQKGGSQLIMGLNPPFGVKASLANKFIDKALEFKPKLLILIVPPETERLDKKNPPYDPVWEDYKFLSGKSFYLPGSVDVNDQQMDQWNATPPVLYLWSRRDWCAKHKATAEKHGHIPILGRSNLGNDSYGVEHNSCHANIEISTSDRPKQIKQQENFSSGKVMADGHQEGSAANDSHVEKLGSHGTERGQSGESRKHGSEKLRLDVDGKSPKNGQRGGNLVTSTNNGMAEGHPSKSSELPLHQEVLQDGCQDLEPGRSRSSDSRRHDEESFGKYVDKISPKAKQNDENFVSNRNKEVRRHSSPIVVNDRIIQENHSSGSVEMALDQEIIQESYQCLEHDMLSTSHAQNRAPYATNRASGHENDGIYKVNEPFSHRLPNVGNMDGLRSQHGATYDTNHAGSRENNVMYNVNSEPLANRSFNVGNMQSRYPGQSRDGLGSNGYGASSVTGFGRDMDLHSKVQPYGYHPGFNIQRNVVDHHHDPGFGRIRSLPSISYGYASPPVESSPYITNMSATQRYAPRLDELNHNRGHEHDPGPLIYSTNGVYDPRAPFYMDPLHFPPGPHNRFLP